MSPRRYRADPGRSPLYPHVLGLLAPALIEPVLHAPYLSITHWLRDFWSWPDGRREAWRQERLQAVVNHARAHVPFYRLSLGSAQTAIPLTDLPVVDKTMLRTDESAFLSEGWKGMRHVVKRTGGTTGDPWCYPLDLLAWSHMYGAALHLWERAGYRYGERLALLGSPPSLVPGATGLKARLRSHVERRVISAAGTKIDQAASLRRAQMADAAGAALWYGYAGTIASMAEAITEENLEITGPRAIVATGENLQPAWRRRIESAFGAPLYDQYGCNDGGVLAQSCRRGRFHLAESVSIVEILDGDQPCPPGVEGDVTVTNLHARVLPFLRYKVGDRAVMAEGACPCGEPGATLERLAGRQVDRLKLPDGTELSALPLWNAFMHSPSVRRWQIVQLRRDVIRVRLEAGPGFSDGEAARIIAFVDRYCTGQAAITLTTTEPIERTAGGKHKVVIRRFD